jgi:broad specificity phosphatase PhoE
MQAHALQKHIAQLPEPLNVEAVIVSPLSRALQTAVGVFGGTSDVDGTSKPLMIQQDRILVRAGLARDMQM